MGRSEAVAGVRDPAPVELSAGERLQWRKVLLALGRRRRADDLLHAPASAASRRPVHPRLTLFHHPAPSHELAFAIEGRAQVTVRHHVFTLAPGRLLVLEPGVYHAEAPVRQDEEYRVCWCHLDRTRVNLGDSRYLRSGRLEVAGLELRGHTDVESIASAVSAELAARQPEHQRVTHHLLAYLGVILLRRLQRGGARPYRESYAVVRDPRSWRQIDRALGFCRRNFRDDIGVSDVAAALHLSRGQLGRLVASHLGVPLSHYLRDLRLGEAKRLLAEEGLPVCSVARAVGYSYPEHFSRAFTRAVGVSPTAYRQHIAEG